MKFKKIIQSVGIGILSATAIISSVAMNIQTPTHNQISQDDSFNFNYSNQDLNKNQIKLPSTTYDQSDVLDWLSTDVGDKVYTESIKENRGGTFSSEWAGDFLSGRRNKIDHWKTNTSSASFAIDDQHTNFWSHNKMVSGSYWDSLGSKGANFIYARRASHGTEGKGNNAPLNTRLRGRWRGTLAGYDPNMKATFTNHGQGWSRGQIKGLAFSWIPGDNDYNTELDYWGSGNQNTKDSDDHHYVPSIAEAIEQKYNSAVREERSKGKQLISNTFKITSITPEVAYQTDGADDASLDNIYYKYSFNYKYSVKEYVGITNIEATEALYNLFTVLESSNQQVDVANGSKWWTNNVNPPAVHIGINNEIIKAAKASIWKTNTERHIDDDASLSSNMKTNIKRLMESYKLNVDNYNDVIQDLKLGKNINLIKPKWATWFNQAPVAAFGNKNLVSWLSEQRVISNKEGGTSQLYNPDKQAKTNLYYLLQYIKASQTSLSSPSIKIHYNVKNGGKNTPSTGVVKTKNIPISSLADFSLPLENLNPDQTQPSIKITGIELNIENNITGATNKIIGILPKQTKNLRDYYINYDPNSCIYSAYYQPNPVNIAAGTWFYKTSGDKAIKFDKDLIEYDKNSRDVWVKQPSKSAYDSFIYRTNYRGQEIEKAFIKPKGAGLDLKTWKTTDGNSTLSQWLVNKVGSQSYDKAKISYIVNDNLTLVINPYTSITTSSDGGNYIDNLGSWTIDRIIDSVNGKTKVLGDWTGPQLSNSFNKAFSLTRTSVLTTDGLLTNGEHSISIQLNGGQTSNIHLNIIVDTTKPKPIFKNISETNEDLYFKDTTGYHRLYNSIDAINASLTESGIRSGTISWVDSSGTWYKKKIGVKDTFVDGHVKAVAEVTVDYQGLFKVEYVDLAGNQSINYLWIKKNQNPESNLITYGKLNESNKENLKASQQTEDGEFYWFNDTTSKEDLLIPNMLSDNDIEVKVLNKSSGKMETLASLPSWISLQKQSNPSVGGTIDSSNQTHSLAGDELKPLVGSGSGVTIERSANPTTFYEAHVNAPKDTYAEIIVPSSIYKLTEAKTYIEKPTIFKIYNSPSYDLPSILKTEEHPNINVTNFEGDGTKTEGNIYKPGNSEVSEIKTQGEDVWRKVSKNFDTKIFPEVIKRGTIKVEWSQLWYDWYEPEIINPDSSIILDKEGKYKITYRDKNNYVHHLNYLVFDYPRDFSKYISRHESNIDGNVKVVTEEFYSNPSVASSQEDSDYHIKGEFILPSNRPIGEWSKNLPIEEVEWNYDSSVNITVNDREELDSIIGSSSIIHVNPNYKEVFDNPNDSSSKRREYQVVVKGWTNNNLSFVTPTQTKYSVDGILTGTDTPKGVPVSVSIKRDLTSVSKLSDNILNQTGYWTGKYIDVYEESNHMDGLLIDNDDDPSTPKVHEMEDYDHYKTFLAEWLANGGTKEDFFQNHTHHDGGTGGKENTKNQIKHSHEENQEKHHKKNKPVHLGVIFGIIGTISVFFIGGTLIYFKRSGKGFKKASGQDTKNIKNNKETQTKATSSFKKASEKAKKKIQKYKEIIKKKFKNLKKGGK